MFKLLVTGLFAVLIVAGCSSVAHINTDDYPDTSFEPVPESDVKVYSTSKIDADYVVIGEVVADADAGENAETAVGHLKKQAAQLGADAIINLRLEIDSGYWQSAIKAYGTAVKLQ